MEFLERDVIAVQAQLTSKCGSTASSGKTLHQPTKNVSLRHEQAANVKHGPL